MTSPPCRDADFDLLPAGDVSHDAANDLVVQLKQITFKSAEQLSIAVEVLTLKLILKTFITNKQEYSDALISLTSQICKIFEAIIRDKMVEFLETHRLINDSQHGFRRGRSCLTNLLCFLDKVTSCLDDKDCK